MIIVPINLITLVTRITLIVPVTLMILVTLITLGYKYAFDGVALCANGKRAFRSAVRLCESSCASMVSERFVQQ
jgi:hypothetical protein